MSRAPGAGPYGMARELILKIETSADGFVGRTNGDAENWVLPSSDDALTEEIERRKAEPGGYLRSTSSITTIAGSSVRARQQAAPTALSDCPARSTTVRSGISVAEVHDRQRLAGARRAVQEQPSAHVAAARPAARSRCRARPGGVPLDPLQRRASGRTIPSRADAAAASAHASAAPVGTGGRRRRLSTLPR